jgi:hypothetical protein
VGLELFSRNFGISRTPRVTSSTVLKHLQLKRLENQIVGFYGARSERTQDVTTAARGEKSGGGCVPPVIRVIDLHIA